MFYSGSKDLKIAGDIYILLSVMLSFLERNLSFHTVEMFGKIITTSDI